MNYPKENEESSRSSSNSHWSSNKNPRIVRVSRNFGGKDRHSKVATIRGLRDRRIRLSVPTAIQLYDLQERLGLSQPSKAVDWLLDVAKEDIDGLPPLPMIPGFTHQLPLLPDDQYHRFSSVGPTYNNHEYNNWPGQAHRNNLSLSQFGGGLSVTHPPQNEDIIPSSGSSQMYYPSSASGLPSFFPPFFSHYTPAASMEINDHLRQINFLEDN